MERPIRQDCHHILNDRLSWSSRAEALALRETRGLIPRIPRAYHENLHLDLPIVPLLGYHALQRTLVLFRPETSTMRTIDNLMLSIEEAINHHRTHPIERELGFLTLEAIAMQRDYLKGEIT